MTDSLIGTGPLLRLAWRRDRWIVLTSVLVLALTAYSTMAATLDLYPTEASAAQAARMMTTTPSVTAFYGPLPSPTRAGIGVLKTVMLGGVFTAILAFALVRRHTRTEEEDGRLELLAAGVVGRRAPLAAAVALSLQAVGATAVLSTLSLIALKVDAAGAIALGVSELIAGIVMTGITAVAVQLTSTTRGAGGIALGLLGLAFVLRALGDTSTGTWSSVSWLSFLGWSQKVAPFGENHVWLLGLALLVFLPLVVLADRLLHRRDLGAGLWPARPGPAYAGRSLSSPLGLSWRLHRGALLGWTIAVAVLGLVVGSMAKAVDQLMENPSIVDMLRQLGGGEGTLLSIFFSTEIRFMAFGTAAFGIATTLRLRSEETSCRAEEVLATAVGRWRWLSSHILVAVLGASWLSLVMGTFGGLAAATVSDVGVGQLLPAAAATLPAVVVCIALTVVLFGALPQASQGAWALLMAFLVLGEFGPLLKLPGWLIGLSPFDHLGSLPGGDARPVSMTVLTTVALGLGLAGAVAFRSRDLT